MSRPDRPDGRVRLGLRANAAQLGLLIALNALVGALVGVERSVLPLVGERDFGLASKAAVLSFVIAFGLAKALANLGAGRFTERIGRRRLLVLGWALALPVAPMVGLAPSWGWIVAANLLLGLNQGLAWSLTALMKIDLAGPARRGLALGLNESAGYVGLAAAATVSGVLAGSFAPRSVVWIGAAAIAVAGLAFSLVLIRDTAPHARAEEQDYVARPRRPRVVRACTQAGFATNLNDALAWGLLPLYLAAHGADGFEIGLVAGAYPAVWGFGQLGAGWLSDRVGRKPLIVEGMLVQAAALAALAAGGGAFAAALAAAVLLGVGTALVYPTLIAAVADAVEPRARPRAVGAYRFWRDCGLVAGALAAGLLADALGSSAAIWIVAALTGASGLWVVATRWETDRRSIDGSDDSHRQVRLDQRSASAYARVK